MECGVDAGGEASIAPPGIASIIFKRDAKDTAAKLLEEEETGAAAASPPAPALHVVESNDAAQAEAAAPSAADDAEEVLDVGVLIEQLNSAIDHVNELEDEHQACCAKHAATARELRSCMSALEAESAGRGWQSAAVAAAEAVEAASLARQQLAAAEHAAAQQTVEQSWAQAELAAADGHEAKLALTQRLSQVRTSIAAAATVVSSARKSATACTSREDKARRHLQRVHGLQSRPWMLPAGSSPALPVDEELAVALRWLSVRAELRKAAQTEAVDLAELGRRKDEAAARVSAAMVALEEKSNEIHERQQAEGAAQGDGGGDDDDDGAGRGSSQHCSSEEGDSDFVLDSDYSGDEDGEDGEGGEGDGADGVPPSPRTPKLHRARSRKTPNRADARRASLAEEADKGILATKVAVARLLRQATEVIDVIKAAPILQPSAPPPPDIMTVSTMDYAVDPWHGLYWVDAESVARSQAEDSMIETQYI